jgi:uncharacterized protein involved in propanediol utilization
MSGILWSDKYGQTPQKKKEIKERKEAKQAAKEAEQAADEQQAILDQQTAELATAQAKENEANLSAEERAKRRRRASTISTGSMGLMSAPQTAVQQLLGV